MNYIGSKLKLSDFIQDTISEYVGDLSNSTFCDIFAGTGIVGRTFKDKVYKVISNDIEKYSFVLNRNYIANCNSFSYAGLIRELNQLPGEEGIIFKNYCPGSRAKRNYFTDENGRKIDHIRAWIGKKYRNKQLSEDQYFFLLCSLIEGADKVANTASVYAAFLKHTKSTAKKSLILEPALFSEGRGNEVYNKDANELIKAIKGDILYMDPPYNARQYGNYYHILNTIADYKPVKVRGKTGMRDYFKSKYCSRRHVHSAFDDLVKSAKFKYIFLSYNNEGLMNLDEIKDVMSQYGRYSFSAKKYQRFKADRSENRAHKAEITTEYLHVLVK